VVVVVAVPVTGSHVVDPVTWKSAAQVVIRVIRYVPPARY
jgi:hypothetical protein